MFCRDNSTHKTVQKFCSRRKDFRRFLQQQPKKIRSKINVYNKRICFVAWLRLRLATSPPPHEVVVVVVVVGRGGGGGGASVASFRALQTKTRNPNMSNSFSFFLSFLLSCLLACKPPTTTTLDDVFSQQKRDVQHQIPKPGARVYLFCSVASLFSMILCVSLRQKNC